MDFHANSFDIFDKQWALLTAGTEEQFNTMTISWGSLGTLWGKPIVTVYVKPIRYTHDFMEQSDYFTVSFYGEEYRRSLEVLGTLSGRDCDKVAKAGLTPKVLEHGMTFQEAKATLVCKKIYRQDLDAAQMPANVVSTYYTSEAAHTMYIGEVVDKEERKMKKITILHLEDCPYCHYARRALQELAKEDPEYGEVSVEWIEESKQPELAKPYGYSYYYVPSIFEGDKKLYEAHPSEDYAACKKNVKAALDIVLDRV